MKAPNALLASLFLIALAACRAPEAPSQEPTFDFSEAGRIIDGHTRRFTESHITGDLAFLDSVFTEDARVYAPGSEVVSGRANISAINAQYVSYGISEFEEISTARYGGPDFIVDEGTYRMTYGPDSTSEAGRYLNVWKRVGGDWKLTANMWTTRPGDLDQKE